MARSNILFKVEHVSGSIERWGLMQVTIGDRIGHFTAPLLDGI